MSKSLNVVLSELENRANKAEEKFKTLVEAAEKVEKVTDKIKNLQYFANDDKEPDWGDVDKSKLRKSCFLVVPDPELKSTWELPYKWIKNPTGEDENGIYIGGTELVHRGAVIAASNTLVGSRGGVDLTPEQGTYAKSILRKERAKLELPEIFSDLETVNISDIELFQAGTKETMDYDENDLDNMVNAFNELSNEIKPPVKLGHNEKQGLLDGLPAGGWISNLRRIGKKLIADFVDVPKKLADLIKTKAYRRVSSEIGFNYLSDTTGKKYPMVLRAVALLGSDIPRIKTLDDVKALYSGSFDNVKTYSMEVIKKNDRQGGGKSMDEITIGKEEYAQLKKSEEETKILSAKVDEFSKKMVEQSKTVEALKAENESLKKDAESKTQKLSEIALKEKRAKINSFIDSRKKEGAWLPAWDVYSEDMMKLDDAKKAKYSEEGKEIEMTDLEREFAKYSKIPANSMVNFTEKSSSQKNEKVASDEDTGDGVINKGLDQKIQNYIEEQRKQGKVVSYYEAMTIVAPAK